MKNWESELSKIQRNKERTSMLVILQDVIDKKDVLGEEEFSEYFESKYLEFLKLCEEVDLPFMCWRISAELILVEKIQRST